MPARFSFVLVVHREQAYVEGCVRSVLDQAAGDEVELIAIDDASPDHAPAVLDALAAADPRVRVEHLAERVGPGAGRNLALGLAAGEYVWFLHSTDALAEGALAAVGERLREAAPDLLLVGHDREGRLGRRRTGPGAAVLTAVERSGPGPIGDHPDVGRTAARAFDKVFARELLDASGARFGPAGHSELSATWPALLAARRIAAAPAILYHRREPANAVRDGFTTGSPFDALDAYEAAIAAAEERGHQLDGLATALLRQGLELIDRVPGSRRREFFARLSSAYRLAGGGGGGLAERLVARDAYGAFEALGRARSARRGLRAAPRAVAGRARRRRGDARRTDLQRHYRARLREPIDPDLAVFAAYWYRDYSCNPRAIYERARELVPDMRAVWVVKREGVDSLPPDVEHVVAGTPDYFDAIARARYLVNNVNFPNHLVKREGTTHVMTHHGTPLKRMGLDLRDAPGSGERIDFVKLLRRVSRWDFSISQNVHTTLQWERTYPGVYESLEVGYPRNDALANATPDDVARAREELGLDPGRRAVLYTPTHREYESEYEPKLDVAAVAEALGGDFVLLARPHYFYGADDALRELHRQGRLVDVADHPSIEQLCLAADALVTDYSSIMFDYAVLDRPIVIHAPDWDVYRARRGVYFDLMEQPPGLVARDEHGVVDALRSGEAWGEEARRLRAAFRARFCSLDDGRAAERVVRRVWLGEREPAAVRARAVAR